MYQEINIDHLFRHQYGKMVSILTKVFGIRNLEIIEDAAQDTFYKAIQIWKINPPDNPEAWLIKVCRNRIIDILRKVKSDHNIASKFTSGPSSIAIQEIFLPHEIEDSQLRMIFTICHPALSPEDQIAFGLKTISGFSVVEIASALLKKEETIKKRLARARKMIVEQDIQFEIPSKIEIDKRIDRVHEILYLLFNEGFHSNHPNQLIKKDLCFEAMRLTKILLDRALSKKATTSALLALMCFHTARIETKTSENQEMILLEFQDRSKWNPQLKFLGNTYMDEAVKTEIFSSYHYEAAIAWEHLRAASFELTDWNKIAFWYEKLYEIMPSSTVLMNQAVVYLQKDETNKTLENLQKIKSDDLIQRSYLFHSIYAEYYRKIGEKAKAHESLTVALTLVKNKSERGSIERKMSALAVK